MKLLIGFLRFWNDLIIGDCWQIAVGIALFLGTGIAFLRFQVFPIGSEKSPAFDVRYLLGGRGHGIFRTREGKPSMARRGLGVVLHFHCLVRHVV